MDPVFLATHVPMMPCKRPFYHQTDFLIKLMKLITEGGKYRYLW